MIRCSILASLVCAGAVFGAPAFAAAQPYIYPNQGQTPQQEQFDRGQCGWTLTIVEETGKMSSTVSADGEGFISFGACTLP